MSKKEQKKTIYIYIDIDTQTYRERIIFTQSTKF